MACCIGVGLTFCMFCLSQGQTFNLESIAVLRGQPVVLPCAPILNQTTGYWTQRPRNSSHGTFERTLWNGNDVSEPSKYKVGRYDLTVDRLDAKDAGTYKCVLGKNGNSRAITTEPISSVELTIVGNYCVIHVR